MELSSTSKDIWSAPQCRIVRLENSKVWPVILSNPAIFGFTAVLGAPRCAMTVDSVLTRPHLRGMAVPILPQPYSATRFMALSAEQIASVRALDSDENGEVCSCVQLRET